MNKRNIILVALILVGAVQFLYSSDYDARVRTFVEFGFSLYPKSLGAVRESSTKKVNNRHVPDQIDIVQKLIFDGAIVWIYRVSAPESKELVSRVEVYSANFKMPNSIRIGLSQKKIEEILGPPFESNDNSVTYGFEALNVELIYRDKKLVQINWFDNGE